jgi:hypothetical protein
MMLMTFARGERGRLTTGGVFQLAGVLPFLFREQRLSQLLQRERADREIARLRARLRRRLARRHQRQPPLGVLVLWCWLVMSGLAW